MGAVKPRHLSVQASIGSWTLSSDPLSSRFQAWQRGKRVFHLSRRASGYRLESRVDGLKLKCPGKAEKTASRGEAWELEEEVMAGARLTYGTVSYSFAWTAVPAHMLLSIENKTALRSDDETQKFRRIMFSLLASVLFLFGGLQFLPEWKIEILHTETVGLAIPLAAPLSGADRRPVERPHHEAPNFAQLSIQPPAEEPVETAAPEKTAANAPAQKRPVAERSNHKAPVKGPGVAAGISAGVTALKSELTAALSSLSKSARTEGKGGDPGETTVHGASLINAVHGQGGKVDTTLRLSAPPGGGDPDPSRIALGGQGSTVSYSQGVHAQVAGQGAAMVTLDMGNLKVQDGLTREEVGAVIHRHMDQIRYCYESARVRAPTLEGKLLLSFTINGVGRVSRVKISESSVDSPILEDCVQRALQSWAFPHPRDGGNVDVNYPFHFKTLGTAPNG